MYRVLLTIAALGAVLALSACGGGQSPAAAPAASATTAARPSSTVTGASPPAAAPSATTPARGEGGLGADAPTATPTEATATPTPPPATATATQPPATATQPPATQPPATEPPPPTPTATQAPAGPTFVSVTATASNQWSPRGVNLAPGGTVQWSWADSAQPHEVTVDYAGASSDIGKTGSFSWTFPAEAGTYRYHCAVHPNMVGAVTVG